MHAGLHRGYRQLRTLSTKIGGVSMSALGQKQTLDWRPLMSALPPKADITGRQWDVRFVPKAAHALQQSRPVISTHCEKGRPVSFQITRYLAGRSKSRNY